MRYKNLLIVCCCSAFAALSANAQTGALKAIPSMDRGPTGMDAMRTANLARAARGGSQRLTFVGPTDFVFPHFAVGGTWETTLVILNMSGAAVTYQQGFFDPSGAAVQVTMKSVPDGQQLTANAITVTLAVGASQIITLPDTGGALQTGWSFITYDSSTARLGGYAIFRQRVSGRPDFEALVPLSAYDDFVFYMPYDNLNGFVTSMAILNPGSSLTTTVSVTILDSTAKVLGTDTLTLTPGQQTAFRIPDRFPLTQNQIGTILFDGSTTRLAGLGFRFNPSGAFATIPILNWDGMFF